MSDDKKREAMKTVIEKSLAPANKKALELYGYQPFGHKIIDLLAEVAAQDHIYEKEKKKKSPRSG